MTEKNRMTKPEMVTAISKKADVRPDVVRDVLAAFTDVAIEQIVNTGQFAMENLFRVSSYPWNGYTAGGGREIPPHTRLSVKLSDTVRTLYKHNQDSEETITQENWQGIARRLIQARRAKKGSPFPRKNASASTPEPPRTKESKPVDTAPEEDFNPVLDDFYSE